MKEAYGSEKFGVGAETNNLYGITKVLQMYCNCKQTELNNPIIV